MWAVGRVEYWVDCLVAATVVPPAVTLVLSWAGRSVIRTVELTDYVPAGLSAELMVVW